MNFGEALAALKEGKKVARSVWGGYWYLAKNVKIDHDKTEDGLKGGGLSQMIWAVLKNNQGLAPAMPYQEDLLAEDWRIVD